MVPPSVITIAANDECLMCSGFSLGETVHFGSFKFIADHFNGLKLSPRRGDSGAAFMGSTHSGTPSLCQAMIEDSAKEFHMASGGEGGFTHSCHNHTMDGERSSHSGHDDGSTMDGGTAARYRPPFRAMPHT
jgi:hypothetical protein